MNGRSALSLHQKPFWDRPGTWDPLLQCLHLDPPLLEQQNTKKLHGTKNNCAWAVRANFRQKIQRDQKPNCHFWRASGFFHSGIMFLRFISAWCAAIHGVAKSRTRLSDWTELNWCCSIMYQYFISFYSCMLLYCMDTPHLFYLLISW